eukprot:GHVU01070449.1.p1 GENE.GHVU01070449.1~~GHVU01070449.1.p1  ORF type:complete len:382 (+),score=33.82 GHVU01070449.1:804-1949(+)
MMTESDIPVDGTGFVSGQAAGIAGSEISWDLCDFFAFALNEISTLRKILLALNGMEGVDTNFSTDPNAPCYAEAIAEYRRFKGSQPREQHHRTEDGDSAADDDACSTCSVQSSPTPISRQIGSKRTRVWRRRKHPRGRTAAASIEGRPMDAPTTTIVSSMTATANVAGREQQEPSSRHHTPGGGGERRCTEIGSKDLQGGSCEMQHARLQVAEALLMLHNLRNAEKSPLMGGSGVPTGTMVRPSSSSTTAPTTRPGSSNAHAIPPSQYRDSLLTAPTDSGMNKSGRLLNLLNTQQQIQLLKCSVSLLRSDLLRLSNDTNAALEWFSAAVKKAAVEQSKPGGVISYHVVSIQRVLPSNALHNVGKNVFVWCACVRACRDAAV